MVEKMKLVRVQGTMPQLNEFIGSCCMDGRFDLEPATRYMSESLGYGALNEENPHTAIRDQIETMAKEANIELHEGQQHSDPVDAEGRSYLSDLLEKIDDLCAERKVLLDQKKLCEDGIEQYSHFTGLKVNVDDILDCAHVKIRFGFLPTEGYNKLMNNYGDDPYILFTPCNQTKAGYWGVYMTPREHALETDGIFSMLYFEPVHVPGAAGSPAEIIEHFKENLDVVNKSVEDVNARIAALWQQNADKVQLLYNTACYYAAVYDLRRMAAVKGEHFFCVGWVPASEVDEVAGKARGIHGLRVTVDGPESAGKMTPPTKLKNPWWSRPFEFFVEMYGLPAYGETDVTGFVAITFTVLFGMMFGDVGQGIVLALFSTFMWKVKHNDLFHLMIPCGISSTIFGLVYGSLFGYEEALDPLYHALGMAGKPVSVMDSITGILMVAVYIVHSMAHGLSALYDTPHGVACAIILPTGLEYNKTAAGERYRAVGKAMGVTGIDEMNDVEAADATIAAVKKLSADVGIPADLKGILKEEDIQFLAESAFADACCPGNPRDTSVEEIKELYRSLM